MSGLALQWHQDVLESLESQNEVSFQCCSEARNGYEANMSYPRGTHMGM